MVIESEDSFTEVEVQGDQSLLKPVLNVPKPLSDSDTSEIYEMEASESEAEELS